MTPAPRPRPFDPLMLDRHPCLQIVAGQAQSGKTTYMIDVLRKWPGLSLAIDANATRPPLAKHLAAWASTWSEAPPAVLPPGVSLVCCDEFSLFPMRARDRYPVLRDTCFRGQHVRPYGLSGMLGTQRPRNVDPNAWSQAVRHVLFKLADPRDLSLVADLPHMASPMGQVALRYLPMLPPGYCVVVDQRDGIFLPYVPEWNK